MIGDDQLPRAGLDGERGHERPDDRDAEVEQGEDPGELAARPPRRRRGPSRSSANAGTATISTRDEEGEAAPPPSPRAARCGRPASQQEARRARPPRCSATNSRRDAEHRGEQDRDEQHARGEVAVQLAALQPEVEEHEGRDGEQRHRRDGLARCAARAGGPCAGRPTAALSSRTAPRTSCSATSPAGAAKATRPSRAEPEREVGPGQAARRGRGWSRPACARRAAARARPRRRPGRGSPAARRAGARRVVQHGPAHREPLDHPARERAHRVVGPAGHADVLEQLLDPRRAAPVQARVVGRGSRGRTGRGRAGARGRQARRARGPSTPSSGQLARRAPARAAVRAEQRGEDAQQRRLAGAVGAEHRRALAPAGTAKETPAEREPLAVAPREPVDLNGRQAAPCPHGGAGSRRRGRASARAPGTARRSPSGCPGS